MQIALWFLLFGLALAVLIKSSDLFVGNSSKFGNRIGISQMFIGAMILAIGTSLPEISTALMAVGQDYSGIVSANVFGSNIIDILLILGIGAIFAKEISFKDDSKNQLVLLLATSILLIVFAYDGNFSRLEGAVMILSYGAYVLSNLNAPRVSPNNNKNGGMLWLIGSLLLIIASSFLVIHSIGELSELTKTSTSIFGASLLALGTTIPEMTVVLSALRKDNSQLAVGTIIGSVIFNSTIVMGLPALISPLNTSSDVLILGVPFLLISVFLLIIAVIKNRLSNLEGVLFTVIYLTFLGQLFNIF